VEELPLSAFEAYTKENPVISQYRMEEFMRWLTRNGKPRDPQFFFPESQLFIRHIGQFASKIGVEVGPGAHNPFRQRNKLHVYPNDWHDFCFFAKAQWEFCGEVAIPTHLAEAEELPFSDSTLDYYVSCHVLEHCPNPIRCLLEARRVLKNGGLIYLTVPKHGAHPPDKDRPVTPLRNFWDAYKENATVDSMKQTMPEIERRGHYYVFSWDSFKALIWSFNATFGNADNPSLEIIEEQETDDKVMNGHTLLLKVNK